MFLVCFPSYDKKLRSGFATLETCSHSLLIGGMLWVHNSEFANTVSTNSSGPLQLRTNMKPNKFLISTIAVALFSLGWVTQSALATDGVNEVRFQVTGERDGVIQGHLLVNVDGEWRTALPSNPRPLIRVQ